MKQKKQHKNSKLIEIWLTLDKRKLKYASRQETDVIQSVKQKLYHKRCANHTTGNLLFRTRRKFRNTAGIQTVVQLEAAL